MLLELGEVWHLVGLRMDGHFLSCLRGMEMQDLLQPVMSVPLATIAVAPGRLHGVTWVAIDDHNVGVYCRVGEQKD